ncbi:MAG: short-chain fatty acyl-CoA regulator family protein [Planktotalea sp.]|uniref:short-chain fatty acyl-CoA regulator family protein n=1 Tax=Planktotalea sp. TaxID=2029877 RepID=UPI003C75FDCC
MGRDTLTGSRIRERRVMIGLKQAELARRARISASYLNLIEHNKRRIGGKLLLDFASILDVEPALLTEGAETALLASLGEVAATQQGHSAELDRVEEFAGRFPGWARLIESMAQRQSSLEQTVVSLTDRMTHDPQLAEALHDMLGAVTAIRSTSSILVETEKLEPEWQSRFHRNINEDAQRLTEGSAALVSYLNGETSETQQMMTPQDEIEAFFERHKFHFPQLEEPRSDGFSTSAVIALLTQASEELISASARAQVEALLVRYSNDAAALPLAKLLDEVSQVGLEPAKIASRNGLDLGSVMRRLASVRGEALAEVVDDPRFDIATDGLGLAVCDSSGTLTMRKPLRSFPLPRFGAACPLWTLYQALSRPMIALRQNAVQSGQDSRCFETMAIAAPVSAPQFGAVPLLQAHMLVIPLTASAASFELGEAQPIGVSCRICPRGNCLGRREPSILASGI